MYNNNEDLIYNDLGSSYRRNLGSHNVSVCQGTRHSCLPRHPRSAVVLYLNTAVVQYPNTAVVQYLNTAVVQYLKTAAVLYQTG